MDVIITIIESHPEACTEYEVMSLIDDFEWHIRNVEGVQSVFGIGVDYGIDIYSRFKSFLAEGVDIQAAYLETLKVTGAGVVFTGITLALGVATWIFAPIKFQADMGILLTFMFLLNMAGAIILLPALACWMKPKG